MGLEIITLTVKVLPPTLSLASSSTTFKPDSVSSLAAERPERKETIKNWART